MQAEPIRIEALNYAYGEGELRRPVLRDVALQVGVGEVLLLTGPSGSGKTTLLTLIGALRAMQEGSCEVLGQELFGASERARVSLRQRIGFIFQNHNLLGALTARQNVAMALEVAPRRNIRTACPASFPVASANVSPLPVLWPRSPALFWPMNQPQPWIRSRVLRLRICCAIWLNPAVCRF